MKYLNFLMIGLLSLSILISCTKEDEGLLVLKVSKTKAVADGADMVIFTLESKDDGDVTDQALFYQGETKLDAPKFASSETGSFEFSANYNGEVSNTVKVEFEKVERAVKESYTKKVLVEKFTGTWCNACPSMSYKIKQAVEKNPNVIPVEIHRSDEMEVSQGLDWIRRYNITRYPSGLINQKDPWTGDVNTLLRYLDDPKSKVGVGIETIHMGTTLQIKVDVALAEAVETDYLKVVVYILQNGIVAAQKGASDDYEHNHVFKMALPTMYGEEIPTGQNIKGGIFSKSYEVTKIPEDMDINKLDVIAFVVKEDKAKNREVINVEKVVAGESVSIF